MRAFFFQWNVGWRSRLATVAALAMVACCGQARAEFVPPSGNTLWLDASSISGVSNGSAVQYWADSSGNSHNFVQNDNVVNAPTYVASGLNGKPVLRFDGNIDGTGDAFYLDTASTWRPSLSAGFTIFTVAQQAGGGNETQGWFGNGVGRVAFGANGGVSYPPNASFTAWAPNYASTYGSANSLNANWNIQTYNVPNAAETAWSWYLNGVATGAAALTDGDPQEYGTDGRLWVGYSGSGNEVWKGDIAEVLMFDHVLTDSQRGDVTGYLAQKYGQTVPNWWHTPAAVPFSSGPAYPGGDSPDPTYAADKAVDGDLNTFCVLTDDTLTGNSSDTYPVNGSDPVTGHMVFDLGAVYKVGGAKLFSRDAPLMGLAPESVDFYLSDVGGNDLGLLTSHVYSELIDGAFESVMWNPVVAQYIGMRVKSSYESGPMHFNFQIAEMQFDVNTVPEPSSVALLFAGLLGLLAYAWRNKK